MSTTITIEVRYPPPKGLRMLVAPALQIGVIGIGVAVGSDAMQWAGFVALCGMGVVFVALRHIEWDHDAALTIDQARKRLDEIEARGH